MIKKVLFCATVDYHFEAFHLPYLKWFKDKGWEVHVAAKGDLDLLYVDKKFNLPIERTPFSLSNFKAFKELKRIIDNNQYQIIHCHTPMGGVLARLAAQRARKSGTKVIYTAHGFHFCKGSPLLNWIVYYPIERWLARYTDCLITINEEDYCIATKRKFRAGRIAHVHGVGVDSVKYKPISQAERNNLRRKHGYTMENFILFYAAELNKNKNQHFLIKVIANLKKDIPHIKLLLAGSGPLLEKYRMYAYEEDVQDEVVFLGYRTDIDELLKISDVAVASSWREGLPVNILEAMASGLPLVTSSNRGHRELVTNGVNGYVVPGNDDAIFSKRIYEIYRSTKLRMTMGKASIKSVVPYELNWVVEEMSKVYRLYM